MDSVMQYTQPQAIRVFIINIWCCTNKHCSIIGIREETFNPQCIPKPARKLITER